MLTASGLSVAHGARVLFDDVGLTLHPGRRVALVGGNGQGKTTLIEIIVGDRSPDAGSIIKPNDMRIGYLPQELPAAPDGTVLDTVLAGRPDIMELHHILHDGPGDDLDAYGDAQTRFEQLGGYAIEADAHTVLAGLGFAPGDAERKVTELSGGWRMRVALARLLLSAPDLLVLDEPTNHLDVDSVGWLENHLNQWSGSLLFVSHDRDFIDNVATHVVELANGTLAEYTGGFAEFVVQREERIEQLEAQAASQAKRIAQTEKFIERFRYKATKARQVQSRIKTIEKLEKIEPPSRKELVTKFAFPEPPRTSRIVAELHGVTAGYDDTVVLRDVEAVVERGQKIALVGPNGAGKSTILKLIVGELPPMDGEAEIGQTVSVAQFEQHQADDMDPDRTVLQVAREGIGTDGARGKTLRTYLASFGFRDDAVERKVGLLSGGERTRLALAKVMAEPVGLLVLDEPTNHLDLASCDVLTDALQVYPGTVLLVTHDRYLIREVAQAIIEVRNGTARFHLGVDEDVLSGGKPQLSTDPTARAAAAKSKQKPTQGGTRETAAEKKARKRAEAEARQQANAAPAAGAGRSAQQDRELRKQVAKLEKAVEKAEAEVAELEAQLADPAIYDEPEKVKSISDRHDRVKQRAQEAMAAWEQAAEQLES